MEWYPTISHEVCVGCAMCMNCGKNVFDWIDEKAKVMRPYNCVVGCSTCGNLCLGKAITFPDIEKIRKLYKKEGIWAKVKDVLKKQGKIS